MAYQMKTLAEIRADIDMSVEEAKQSRDLFRKTIADDLEIHPDQLRGIRPTITPTDLYIKGRYRKDGKYFLFTLNINTGDIIRHEEMGS